MENDTYASPPAGFRHQGPLTGNLQQRLGQLPVWQQLLWANLLALLPLSTGVILLWLPYQIYLFLGAPYAYFPTLSWSMTANIIWGILIVLSSIVIHELLHGLVLHLAGHRPFYFIRFGVPHVGMRPGTFLTKNQYLLMALTPFIVMTLLGGLLLILIPPAVGKLLLLAILLNMAASIGDLYIANMVRVTPADALFASQKGIQVFVPAY